MSVEKELLSAAQLFLKTSSLRERGAAEVQTERKSCKSVEELIYARTFAEYGKVPTAGDVRIVRRNVLLLCRINGDESLRDLVESYGMEMMYDEGLSEELGSMEDALIGGQYELQSEEYENCDECRVESCSPTQEQLMTYSGLEQKNRAEPVVIPPQGTPGESTGQETQGQRE